MDPSYDARDARADGFLELAKGFGTAERPYYLREQKVSVSSMLDLVEQDWLAAAIVQRIPEMSLREGFVVKRMSGEIDTSTKDAFEAINYDVFEPEGLLRAGLVLGRAAGGAAIVLLPDTAARGSNSTSPDNVASPAKPGEGVRQILVFAWSDLKIISYVNDRNSKEHGKPEIYEVIKQPWAGLRVHASRLVPCEGSYKKDRTWVEPWVSVLDPVYSTLADYGFAWEGASQLIKESSILIVKMQGLINALGVKGGVAQKQRFAAMTQSKSLFKTLFLDSQGEDATRINTSFADLPALLDSMSKRVAGAAKTPITILFGMSPAGMNATGESDLQQFYDQLVSYQTKSIAPKLAVICSAIAGDARKVEFNPPWTLSATQKADYRAKKLATDQELWKMDVVSPLQILVSRAHDGTLDLEIPEDLLKEYEDLLAKGEREVPGIKKEPPESLTNDPTVPPIPPDTSDETNKSVESGEDPNNPVKRMPPNSDRSAE
jgi:phage-related protein (TIGR01555 family)